MGNSTSGNLLSSYVLFVVLVTVEYELITFESLSELAFDDELEASRSIITRVRML